MKIANNIQNNGQGRGDKRERKKNENALKKVLTNNPTCNSFHLLPMPLCLHLPDHIFRQLKKEERQTNGSGIKNNNRENDSRSMIQFIYLSYCLFHE